MSITQSPHRAPLSALDRGVVWLGSEPLTAELLRGHVVAINFWTYSCVNWLRTLPYIAAWDERYRGRGLIVVGVHAPEFGFEHELDNVRRAVAELGVNFPVVIDNDFTIWRSFDNHYWPAVYLIDRDGLVGFHHYGEGAYEGTERAIQQLVGGRRGHRHRGCVWLRRGRRLRRVEVSGDLPRLTAWRAASRRFRQPARAGAAVLARAGRN